MSVKVVVFDCDGVLFDSREANAAYYGSLALEFGRVALSEEEREYVHVHTVFDSVGHVFRDNPGLVPQVHEFRLRRGYGPFLHLMVPAQGVYECLEDLSRDHTLGVFTNRSDTIKAVLETHRMQQYFSIVVSALDVKKPKPDPEGLLKILAQTGASPRELAYLGDAPSDAQAAQAAGTLFIAYQNPDLADGPVINHFCELREVLRRL